MVFMERLHLRIGAFKTDNKDEANKRDVKESFRRSKIVYMITFTTKGETHSRPMTNFNEDPYTTMYFSTYLDTRKVRDIKENTKTLIIFPGLKRDEFHEIECKAGFADEDTVEDMWEWWYLYWHPEMKDYFWFSHDGDHPERVIIELHPIKVKTLTKQDVHYIQESYKTLELNEKAVS